MSTEYDYIAAIDSLVKGDELPLGEPEKQLAIDAAFKEHSRNRPRIVPEDEAGNGGFDYAVTLLASWSEGFSSIKKIEYPVDDTVTDDTTLQDSAWRIYAKPSGKVIRFLQDTPAATEHFRVTYTALHEANASECSVPDADEQAVQMLAASYFCKMLAAYFSATNDSTIQADSVNHKSKASEYAARAKMYREGYFNHLGQEENKLLPASLTRDQDALPSWRTDKITHPGKFR